MSDVQKNIVQLFGRTKIYFRPPPHFWYGGGGRHPPAFYAYAHYSTVNITNCMQPVTGIPYYTHRWCECSLNIRDHKGTLISNIINISKHIILNTDIFTRVPNTTHRQTSASLLWAPNAHWVQTTCHYFNHKLRFVLSEDFGSSNQTIRLDCRLYKIEHYMIILSIIIFIL